MFKSENFVDLELLKSPISLGLTKNLKIFRVIHVDMQSH